MARKLAALRLWEDGAAGRRWASSAADLGLEILCVSQFTLYHTMKGNKPDFRLAMAGNESRLLYQVGTGTGTGTYLKVCPWDFLYVRYW